MTKLYYVANVRMTTERAHGIQIAKMCEAFARQGLEVRLVVTNRKSHLEEDMFSYYGVARSFKLVKLWCLDTVRFGRWGFRIETLAFALRALTYFVGKDGIFYTRDEFLAFFLRVLSKQVVWEVHMGQCNFLARAIVRLGVPLVVISQGLKDVYVAEGVPAERILVAPDGVDVKQFNFTLSKEEARGKLGLPSGKPLAMYTGSRQPWKGVETLEGAAGILGEAVRVEIISGKPYSVIPLYLKAADVLVLPNTAKLEISRSFTSPMKLFEYMASGTPIVASDIPSIREVLDESTAYFSAPDNPHALAHAIQGALEDPEAPHRAERALERVKSFSWERRAERILSFISHISQ